MASNVDHFDRRITYLRVSVTDRCNLRCRYCVPVRDFSFLKHAHILRYEEILRIIRIGVESGIRKVRLTGGEPLIRRNFAYLVQSVCAIPGLEDVSITTNGVFLKKRAKVIFAAGVRRLNVSLDTLSQGKYARITGKDRFHEVWEGIEAAEDLGFSPIKINVVAIRGVNDDEFVPLARLSLQKPYHVRFIEYMPIGKNGGWTPEKFVSSDAIKARLESIGPISRVASSPRDGPVMRYRFKGAKGEIGFISAMSHHFCRTCNRLRLTADGRLRPCLFSNEEVDVMTPLRQGCRDRDLKALFHEAIDKKPEQHHAGVKKQSESGRPMSAIGG